jgi:hypothetical protein
MIHSAAAPETIDAPFVIIDCNVCLLRHSDVKDKHLFDCPGIRQARCQLPINDTSAEVLPATRARVRGPVDRDARAGPDLSDNAPL